METGGERDDTALLYSHSHCHYSSGMYFFIFYISSFFIDSSHLTKLFLYPAQWCHQTWQLHPWLSLWSRSYHNPILSGTLPSSHYSFLFFSLLPLRYFKFVLTSLYLHSSLQTVNPFCKFQWCHPATTQVLQSIQQASELPLFFLPICQTETWSSNNWSFPSRSHLPSHFWIFCHSQPVNTLSSTITYLLDTASATPNTLPCTLTHFSFGIAFNQQVDDLPSALLLLDSTSTIQLTYSSHFWTTLQRTISPQNLLLLLLDGLSITPFPLSLLLIPTSPYFQSSVDTLPPHLIFGLHSISKMGGDLN